MVADGVVKLHAEDLFGFAVEVEETRSAVASDAECVEDMVATLNREISFDCSGFLEALMAANCGVQFRL